MQTASARQCLDPRRQLRKGERFYQIVIRAAVQTLHPILDSSASRQNKDWKVCLPAAHILENGDPIEPRQIQIEHDQIVVKFGSQCACLFAIRGHVYRIVFCFQTLTDKARQGRIVFGDPRGTALSTCSLGTRSLVEM